MIGACAVLTFTFGCSKPAEQSTGSTTTTSSGAATAPQSPLPVQAFSPAQTAAARKAKAGGGVSIDVFDHQADGTPNTGGLTLAGAETLYVLGWAYDESKHAPCAAAGLLVDAKTIFPGAYGSPRTDVAAFYKDPARTNVGVMVKVPAHDLGGGSHEARLVCVGSDGTAHSSAASRNVTVR